MSRVHPIAATPGELIARDAFIEGQKRVKAITLMVALQYVQTRRGAERIWRAELLGNRRPVVLEAASRRLDDFTRPRTPKGAAFNMEN